MSIDPPLPAVSRPSKMTTMRWPVSDTQRAIALSSLASGFNSSRYSSSLISVEIVISLPPCRSPHAEVRRCCTYARRLEQR